MTTLKLKKFTRIHVLKSIGRDLLARFFGAFGDAGAFSLPPPDAQDKDFFEAIARLLLRPEGLRGDLTEVLMVIEEMSSPAWNRAVAGGCGVAVNSAAGFAGLDKRPIVIAGLAARAGGAGACA
jgi:hypothetical protein